MDAQFWIYAEQVLDRLYPLLERNSSESSLEEIKDALLEHADKTAGYPMNLQGAPTKGQALAKFSVTQLLEIYRANTSVIGSTLKDEIRVSGKDARLFRPQDVTSYCEAVRLFQKQNEYLASNVTSHPLFIKYVTPGRDLSRLYTILRQFGGKFHDADGASFDANFPLNIAAFICYWRSKNASDPDSIREYYSRMYNGYTSVAGWLLHLIGQPSGHFNTTTDNSLCQVICMAYAAYNCNLSVREFLDKVKFFCCGDDLIWADKTGLLYPENVSRAFASAGVFLEFSSKEHVPFYDLTFVSTHPVDTEFGLSYVYDLRRMKGKSNFFKRSADPRDKLAKMTSLASLVFNSPLYKDLREALLSYFAYCVSTDQVSPTDVTCLGLIHASSKARLRLMYFVFN